VNILTEHKLKTLPEYFEKVLKGDKTFEIRENDRNFKENDTLILQEYIPNNPNLQSDGYTGREIRVKVPFIFFGGKYGLDQNYCIMSIKLIEER
jgi:hypothetical protein